MDIHYNAFISYRHHPEDIRVATEIHRALEHYRIPKAVRKNQKGNLRLFRDKDELPITSNLSDDIFRALQNSDFLIVICSNHTKESVWVQREIETFLKTHTYDKVLSVLVDGEPYDTIPEILQYREEVDPDTGEVKKIPIEPLSCDWRVGKKAAYREELPRLAAALLHCGYDELRQRQRQYKMRRMIAFFSAALVASVSLMTYFLYTSIKIQRANENLQAANEEIRKANVEIQEANVEIQNNLNAALRNQSEYLASAANERFEAGDRMTAISLAMAALPSGSGERPYVPDAELILAKALGIYTTEPEIVATGIMDCGAIISAFDVTDDGKIVYTADKNNRIIAWDTEKYAQLAVIDLHSSEYFRMNVSGSNLVIQLYTPYGSNDPELCCYSSRGELLWTAAKCDDYAFYGEDTVMVLNHNMTEGMSTIEFLNAQTGVSAREAMTVPVEGNLSPEKFYQDIYTPGLPVAIDYSDWDHDYVYIVDPETGGTEILAPFALWKEDQRDDLTVLAVNAAQNGDILVKVSDGSGKYNGIFNGMVTTSPARSYLLCYRKEDLQLRWKQSITTYSYNTLSKIESIPGTNRILCQDDNMFLVLDGETGEILAQCEAMANILSVTVEEDKAIGLMDDGCFYNFIYEDNQCTAMRLMDSNLIQAKSAHGSFTLQQNSTYITEYKYSEENGWTVYPDVPDAYVRSFSRRNNLIMMATSNKSLHLFDMNTGTFRWTVSAGSGYSLELLGFSEDGKTFYAREYGSILAVDVASGEISTMEIPAKTDDAYAYVYGFYYLSQDRLHYLITEGTELYLAEMDLHTGEAQIHPFNSELDEGSLSTNSGVVYADEDYIWLWDTKNLLEVSRNDRTTRKVLSNLATYPLITFHEEENLFSIGVAGELLFMVPGGEVYQGLDLEGENAVSVCFHGDEILVLTSDAKLTRYDRDGKQLGKSELTVYTSFYASCSPTPGKTLDIKWDFTGDGELVLGVFGLGNIIDCEEWGSRAYIPSYYGFDHRGNRILCYSDYKLGYFPRYTTEEVTAIAVDQLNGYQLPEEVKNNYGID